MTHERHVITGIALVLGLLFIIGFGSLTITSFTTANVEKTPFDFRFPLIILLVAGCGVILLYVFNQQKQTNL